MSTRWFCGTFITFVVVLMLAGCKSSGNGQSATPQPSPQQAAAAAAAAATRDITAHTEDAANHTPNPGHNDADHCFEREKPGVKRYLVLTVTAQEISANNLPTAFLVDLNTNNQVIIQRTTLKMPAMAASTLDCMMQERLQE
jgi:ABC-type glycerol-3-phosphate transport system substrate-binding protein